jgi:hypothetical protein
MGVAYLDLRGDFFSAKATQRLFPRTDTHWDAAAIELAAQAIAGKLGPGKGLTAAVLPARDTILYGFRGDLSEKFAASAFHSLVDTVRPEIIGDGKGGRYREPDSADILLYGDSFLNQYKAHASHLGAHLARRMGVPVKSVYSLSGFTEGPSRIREILRAFPRTKAVVWVFTSRTLMEAVR